MKRTHYSILFATTEKHKADGDEEEDEGEKNDDPTNVGVDAAQNVQHPCPDRNV